MQTDFLPVLQDSCSSHTRHIRIIRYPKLAPEHTPLLSIIIIILSGEPADITVGPFHVVISNHDYFSCGPVLFSPIKTSLVDTMSTCDTLPGCTLQQFRSSTFLLASNSPICARSQILTGAGLVLRPFSCSIYTGL